MKPVQNLVLRGTTRLVTPTDRIESTEITVIHGRNSILTSAITQPDFAHNTGQ